MTPRYLVALAALAAQSLVPALAQSTVNISGYLDIGVSKRTGGQTTVGSLGRSNLAFSGTEDLGGGLAATFRLSTRWEMDTGALESAPAGQRQFWQDESTVGLKGSLGALRAGRALTPLNAYNWLYDPWYAFNRVASPMFRMTAPDFLPDPGNVNTPTGTDLDYTRMANGVFYDSPVMSGFQVHAVSVLEKKPVDQKKGHALALRYGDDKIGAMVDVEQNSQNDKLLFVAGSYRLGALALMGSYNRVKLNPNGTVYGPGWTNWAGASNPTTKRTSVTLGATYDIGAGTVRAGYGRDFQGATNFFNYIGSTFNNAGTGYSGATNFYSLGYNYNLSKRTSLSVSVARENWKITDDNGRRNAMGTALGMVHTF